MRLALISLLMIPLAVGCGEDAEKGASSPPPSVAVDTDADGDGVAAEVDCDDNDPESTTVSTDGDCDGVLTGDDCDDFDSASTTVSVDGDCDGVPTEEDCDDEDASVSLCWKTIEAGNVHTCGITMTGETKCWGHNEFGQSTPPEGSAFASLSLGRDNTCGLTETGAVECWGRNQVGQSTPPEGVNFTSVALGYEHGCGITTEGNVACWGRDLDGSTEPPDSEFSSIDAAGYLTCGVADHVHCWGRPETDGADEGMNYGDGVTYYIDVKTSSSHTCAIAFTPGVGPWTDCVGWNTFGQCSDEDIGWVDSVAVGGANTCAITLSAPGVYNPLYCRGYTENGVNDVPPDHEFKMVTLGDNHACALTTDSKAVCWGNDDYGQVDQPQATGHIDAL